MSRAKTLRHLEAEQEAISQQLHRLTRAQRETRAQILLLRCSFKAEDAQEYDALKWTDCLEWASR